MTTETKEKGTILIVDDSSDSRLLLSLILQKEGYDVLEVSDGEEALEKARKASPDLILLDILMPVMDGYEVCRLLKADEALGDIPVIFMSSLGEAKDKIRGLNLGGADYITKPFDRGEVLARIRNQIHLRNLTKDLLLANRALREKQGRLDEDLRAAAGIQESLLPRMLPTSSRFEMDWRFIPCQTIGGDIFNVLVFDEDHLGFYMLDVSGHGVPSALVTVSISQVLQPHSGGILREATKTDPAYRILEPREVLYRLEQDYPMERFEKYVTIFYGVVHIDSDELVYGSAGHPPAFLLRKSGETVLLDRGGPIIGLGMGLSFESGTERLYPGDQIVLYTDGVLEIQNPRGAYYGMNRFAALLDSKRGAPISVLVGAVIDELRAFSGGRPFSDDITLLGMTYQGRSTER